MSNRDAHLNQQLEQLKVTIPSNRHGSQVYIWELQVQMGQPSADVNGQNSWRQPKYLRNSPSTHR